MMKGSHCPCIAISHDHVAGQCDEPQPANGESVCLTCRYPMPVTPSELEAAVQGAKGVSYRHRRALLDLIDAAR